MTAPLIGLVGKKRVGKDTFAERLIAEHGFVKVSFSEPVKDAALAVDPIILGWTDRITDDHRVMRLSEIVEEEGWERAKEEPEVRRFLQRFGTESIRAIDPDFWVRHGMQKAVERMLDGRPVVITDVRFKNEARAITAAGGKLVRIERPGSGDGDTHASEVELDTYPVDFLVSNDGSLDQLHNKADAIAARL